MNRLDPGSRVGRVQAWFSSLRLPVRIPVPNRNNLIAMGLMALAFGLMVGVAIGPALGAASNAVAGAVAPLAAAPPPAEPEAGSLTDVADEGVTLGSPAGSEETSSSVTSETSGSTGDSSGFTDPGDSTGYASTDIPDSDDSTDKAPAKIESEPEPEEEKPAAEGTELKGTVVGVDPDAGGYDIADSSGNVLALHASEPPLVGQSVATRIEPLANGTFAEVDEFKAAGLKTKAKLRGTVSWVDHAAGLVVLSSRGTSLAVDIAALPEEDAAAIGPGSPVEGVVLLGEPVPSEDGLPARPGLSAESLGVTGEPLESFDLNGVIGATGLGASERELTVSADGAGIVPVELTVEAPKDFDPALVTPGKTYNLSVDRGADGRLKLTGLSPDYNRKVAGDTAAAFGTHA